MKAIKYSVLFITVILACAVLLTACISGKEPPTTTSGVTTSEDHGQNGIVTSTNSVASSSADILTTTVVTTKAPVTSTTVKITTTAPTTTVDPDAPLSPGLYTSEGNLVASWNDLVNKYEIDVTKDYIQYDPDLPAYKLLDLGVADIYARDDYVLILGDVDKIGEYAFCDFASLAEIVIPETVTSIGSNAFFGCIFLTELDIPKSVVSIGDEIFPRNITISSINVDKDNPIYRSENGHLIESASGRLIRASSLLNIPDGVKIIEDYAFCGHSRKALVIPKSVTTIEPIAFYRVSPSSITVDTENPVYKSDGNCLIEKDTSSLILGCESSIIPSYVVKIGDHAFYKATSDDTNTIIIPEGVVSIGNYAFESCFGLTEITLPSTLKSIGNYAFYGCRDLRSIVIPSGVTSIGESAFSNCTKLKSVNIEGNILCIPSFAFCQCPDLKSIEIPVSVTSIDFKAFDECATLTDIYFGGSAEDWSKITVGNFNEILESASIHFNGSEDITPEKLAAGLYDADSKLIASWEELVSVYGMVATKDYMFDSEKSNESAPYYVLSNFDALKEGAILVIGDISSVGEFAFSTCPNITKIIILDGVFKTDWYAFADCTSLRSVVISKTVDTIGYYTFNGCVNLESIVFEGTKDEWNKVSHGNDWLKGTKVTEIICSDGIVPVN